MPTALPTLIIKMPRTDRDRRASAEQQQMHSGVATTPSHRRAPADCTRTRKRPMGTPRSLKRPPRARTDFSSLKRLLRRGRSSGGVLNAKSLILLLVLLAALFCVALAKPNTNQNQNNQNKNPTQNQFQLSDKQLIRKAHDSSESLSRDTGSGSNRASGNNAANSQGAASNSSASQEQSSSSSSVFSCPEQFGYYTDTKDCTKYYVCVFGEVLHESCTGGLRFSRELQTCDWPRNVECPAGQPLAGPDATSATTPPSGPSTAASSGGGSTQATTMSSFSSASAGTTPASASTTTASSASQQSNQVEGGAGGRMKGAAANTMAFADEASDPQQPSFDEAVSPVITADGAIHLHDGSGGTFGLAPNHNRALQSPQSLNGPVEAGGLSGAGSSSGRNMDVFVMPLSISNQGAVQQQQQQHHGAAMRPSASSNNKRQQQQQQFSANSGQNQARQHHQLVSNLNQADQEFGGEPAGQTGGQGANKVLLPATLPPRARQQQAQFESSNNNDLTSRQTPSDSREEARNNLRDAELSDESGDFNLGSSNEDDGDGAGVMNSDANLNDGSLSAQADQDSMNDHDGSPPANGDQQEPNSSADNENSGNNGGQPAAYVPPVITGNTFAPPKLQNSQRPPNRQQQASSPLLSINNRQIVDPTRQTFKPIIAPSQAQLHNGHLISSSEQQPRPPQRSQQPNINLNAQNVNINTNRQMNLQQQQQQQQNNRQSRMSSSSQAQAQNLVQALPQQARPRPAPLTNTFQAPSNQSARFFLAHSNQQLVASNVNTFANEAQQQPPPKVPRLQSSAGPPNRGIQNLPQATFPARFPSNAGNNFQQNSQQQTSAPPRSQNSLFPTPRPFNTNFINQPAAGQPFELPTSSAANNFSSPLPLDQFSASADQFIRNNEPALQSVAPRRSRPPKRNQIPNQNRRQPNLLLDFDTTTTTSTTMSTPTQRFQTTDASNFNTDNGMLDGSQDPSDQQGPSSAPPENFAPEQSGAFEAPVTPSTRQQPPLRPLVPTNSVNFRDATTFATQQPPPLSSTAGNSLARPQRPPSQTSSPSSQLRASSLSTQQASTTLASSPAADEQSAGAPQTTPDPQAVANRYLNSAIDALEAGQPFGTVDYDFDILNDNQTDRRQVAAGASADSLPLSNFTSSRAGERAQTITRQRLQQQAAAAAVAAAASQDQGEGQEQRGAGRARAQSASSPGANNQQQAAAAAPTKKPRPTNKKISVNHEQALLNNRASTEPARRPEPLFATPQPLQTAGKCDARTCRLPDCKCGDTLNPAGLEPKAVPQIVLLTFDDAVNDLNWEIYEELFSGRTNPNGCPLLATFYVSHEWTDYGQVQTLYSRGHEMASHSVTHSFGEKFSKSQWFKEINGQREILNMYGGVKLGDVRGMRAPFLQIGGNKMFEMLYDANFTYDSSMPIFENSPPLWPYTLDYQLAHECMITPCPTKSFPGVWEVGMTMWVDLRGGRCSMGDACSNPTDEDGVYEMLMKNFHRHYNSNRAPFGLFYHSAWFNTVHHRRGFLRFLSTVNALPEVFFVTNWQMLQWMRQPTPLSEINSFEPWQCPAKNDRPPPCHHPAVCNVKSEHGTRFMKTCQPCPANQQYPWVGATGFNKSKQSGSG